MLVCATANAIPIGANHSGAQLVEELKGGLVAREAELPLELDRGYAGSLAGDEIGDPKPDGQRRAAALHHRADSQSCLARHLRHVSTPDGSQCGTVRRSRRSAGRRSRSPSAPSRDVRRRPDRRGRAAETPAKTGEQQRRALLHIHHNGRRRSHCPIQPRRKALAERDRQPADLRSSLPTSPTGVCVNRIGMLSRSPMTLHATSRKWCATGEQSESLVVKRLHVPNCASRSGFGTSRPSAPSFAAISKSAAWCASRQSSTPRTFARRFG